MQCIVQGCPGEMEERRIVHTFVREGKPIVFALDPETDTSVSHAPVFRLSLNPTPAGVE